MTLDLVCMRSLRRSIKALAQTCLKSPDRKFERDHLCHSRKKLGFDVRLGVTSSCIPYCRKAYHIPKALVRASTKAIISSSAIMTEVCFGNGRTFLWAGFVIGHALEP